MNLRTTAITVIALSTFAVPTGLAAAGPLPDPPPPPPRTAVLGGTDLGAIRAELSGAYRAAPWAGKRRLHNEITLLLNLGNSAL